MKQPPNFRFWEWINGAWVKITLKPNQHLSHYKWQSTDEGWNSELTIWHNNGEGVGREWVNDGRDCDGRLRTSGRDFCPADQLAEVIGYVPESRHRLSHGTEWMELTQRFVPGTHKRIYRPNWVKAGSTHVYDEEAQKAGY